MIINSYNTTNNAPAFKGYGARPIKGFIMNSNFGGIADEIRRIGLLENFDVFLFQNEGGKFVIKTNNFEISPCHNGCWAQDYWGIVKNTLLAYENNIKTSLLYPKFGLKSNPVQENIRIKNNYVESAYGINILQSAPIVNHNGKFYVECAFNGKIEYVEKEAYDKEKQKYVDAFEELCRKTHIKGGNYFITQNASGEEELLIGRDELKKFSLKDIREMFGIKRVSVIPQADFHLDLFLRPLKGKTVLIADDNLMIKIVRDAIDAIKNTMKNIPSEELEAHKEALKNAFVRSSISLEDFQAALRKTKPFANMREVEQSLIKEGYKPIHVPARMFDVELWKSGRKVLKCYHNYLNAHAIINNNNELVYITNKSDLNEQLGFTKEIIKLTGFSPEEASLEKIRKHVDKVYVVSGENDAVSKTLLQNGYGGIHCACAEIPQ